MIPWVLWSAPPDVTQGCQFDDSGNEYYIDKDGNKAYTEHVYVESEPGCKLNDSCMSTEAASNRKWVDFGDGWFGGVDPYNNSQGFEIHVYHKGKEDRHEKGIVSGRWGWIRKHDKSGQRPPGIPNRIVDRINGQNLQELRARGAIVPGEPIRRGAYLDAGRTMWGATGAINFLRGIVDDVRLNNEASKNGRSFQEQQRIEMMKMGPYIDTIIGPIQNPYYGDVDL